MNLKQFFRLTRGQWPYIPASTRAMRNRHVVLYDLNYPSKYITPNDLGGHLTSDLKSATLITLVSMCILPLTVSEAMAAYKRPRRSYDLRFEISNLDYPGIHVHIASNGLRGHGGLQTTSEVIWRLPWPLRLLEAICTWITG